MSGELKREHLVRRWVHSHEEDTDTEQMFRPAEYPFPPSRGREAWNLRGDGTLTIRRPGPADAPQEAEGTWALDGRNLLLRDGGGAERSVSILHVDDGRLVVTR